MKLPVEMKEIGTLTLPDYTAVIIHHIITGDSYVRNEFKLHKEVTNSEHLDKFFYEWKQYLKAMDEAPVVDGSIGKDLEKEEINPSKSSSPVMTYLTVPVGRSK